MRTEEVRAEIAAAIPAYNGIQNLKKQGDNFEYGGPMLCANWKFATPMEKRISELRQPPSWSR
jgi:hypothetical protein